MHGTEQRTANVTQILRALQRSSVSDAHPGRRLRIAVLLRAFADVREGGRDGWEALRWLLDDRPSRGGLSARDLMEEFGLDVSALRATLRSSYGRVRASTLPLPMPNGAAEAAEAEDEADVLAKSA